jgi:ATP-dependent Clp protease ATP-binding subunit ClpA
MPQHELPLILVTQQLGTGLALGEAILFPEMLVMHEKAERLRAMVRGLAKKLLAESAPIEVHRRMMGETAIVSRLRVELEPPKRTVGWSEAISLNLDVMRWRHGEEGWIAYVPALGISVVAGREEQLEELVPRHIRSALSRSGASERLFDLAQLARVESISIEREMITADIQTPAEMAAERSKKEGEGKPVIEEVGSVLDEERTARAFEVDAVVKRLGEAMTGPGAGSVLLVGASGVGKTAIFGELFHQRRNYRLGGSPFWATSGARLIAGMSGFGVWQERCQKLCRQAKRAGAILHLGNLVELMEVGKAGGSQFGIANFFRPFLARRDVLAVVECTPEQLPVIEKSNPHLLTAFTQVVVEEPGAEVVTKILSRVAGEGKISARGLDAIVRLHARYATYSASPGRPLRFLKNLLADGAVVDAREVTAAFSRETGLPLFLLDEAVELDLSAVRGHFAGRVIGQTGAVDLVSDLLATVKAGMNRPRRPIASLLFIGPTGVGKTEMAKALADYFFGAGVSASSGSSSPRLVRFDMSEFQTSGAVARLVGTAWETEGLLTAKIREQPFCVLLLDEFEKADASFFDLLLQVLGEGRLTDSAGRLADFSNAIVVMTSNLGAGSFGAGPFGLARGRGDAGNEAGAHFTEEVQRFLRPELFNRIDRIVPFLPLDQETIGAIARREIELISRRDGVRGREMRLEISPGAIGHLAKKGYDPLYGVRPLKRRIEQDLLAPLADGANQYSGDVALVARVEVAGEKISVVVRGVGKEERVELSTTSIGELPALASAARRRLARVARCPAAMGLANELFTLQRAAARKAARGRHVMDPLARERLKRLHGIHELQARLSSGAIGLEDAVLLHQYEAAPLDAAAVATQLGKLGEETQQLLLELYCLNQSNAHGMTLGLYGNAAAELFSLARAYFEVAGENSVSVGFYTRLGKTSLQRTTVAKEKVGDFLNSPLSGVHGIVLGIRSPFARARFETEAGLHVIEEDKGKNQRPILVDAWPRSAAEYRPPKDVEFRIALAGQRRRTYTMERQEVEDRVMNKTYRWTGKWFSGSLLEAIEENLRKRVEGMLE